MQVFASSSYLAYKKFHFDWATLCCAIFLNCIGIFFIYSTTYTASIPCSLFVKKQILGCILGIGIFCCCSFIDYHSIIRWGYFGYWALLAILLYTVFKGHIGMGAARWINFAGLKGQPSEMAKYILPLFIGYHLRTADGTNIYRTYLLALAYLVVCCCLIRIQPDLGTATLLFASGFAMIWCSGIPRSLVYTICSSLLLMLPIIWYSAQPYQKQRVFVFLGYGQKNTARYQVEQSIIAVGSGGLSGKGFMHGTQHILQFLPESRTDFIFAVICEELGLWGACIILCIYIILFAGILMRILAIPLLSVQITAWGLLLPLVLATIINIGMVVGVLPVVGIPLPFMSYGLSNLLVNYAALGTINGMIRQQFAILN